MKDKWGKLVQLAGMFKRLSETNQNDFGLEEHFWARPSSSKVGTELNIIWYCMVGFRLSQPENTGVKSYKNRF